MPSYAQPLVITYTRTVGTADATWSIATPPGCTQFRVMDIGISVTTTFTNTANNATLGVGVATHTSDAGFVDLGTTADGTAVSWKTQLAASTNPVYQTFDLSGTSNTISGTPKYPEVSGPLLITFTADADGGAAGAGIADVTIAWF